MFLTFRYRLLPTKNQHRALENILEGQRQLYNAALEERIGAYRKAHTSRSYVDQCKALTEWRREDQDAAALPVALQRWTLRRLHEAYRGFFRRVAAGGKPGFPRFRSKKRFQTFGFSQFSGIRFQEGRIRFQGLPGTLRVHVHRPLPAGRICSCTFRRELKTWRMGLMVEVPGGPPRSGSRSVGVDLGISTFAVLSDGDFIPSLRAARRAERQLRIAQRALARKKQGSARRNKARLRVAACQAAIARARLDHLHRASAKLIHDYDTVAIERLNVKALSRGRLAKDVHDAGWSRFISMLRYKAACAGSRIVEVDPKGTSQLCSCCGATVAKKLEERRHECMNCGLSMDRDLNAARNVLNRAVVGPGLQNVADYGKRADGNLGEP